MDEVRFCGYTLQHDIEEVVFRIKDELQEVNVEVESCLGRCDACTEGPFVLVNDELIQADDADELFEKVKATLGY